MLNKDGEEILTSEFVSISGGLLTGVLLAVFVNKIYLIPGLFILMPGFLEMRGALGGALASRISSGLYLGVLKPRFKKNPLLITHMLGTAMLIIASSLVLGIFAFLASRFIFDIHNPEIIFISLIAGTVSIFMIPITATTTLYVFRKGYDPNNIMGPFITTLGDIVSVASFLVAILVIT